jgi:preprotein translocase subunit SecD
LTLKDIQEVKRIYNNNTNRPEISIEMTKEGAGKFYLFTKKNTGKHIAVVIARQIVSVPKVNSAISDGKAVISGDFTDEEIDKMIEILNKK